MSTEGRAIAAVIITSALARNDEHGDISPQSEARIIEEIIYELGLALTTGDIEITDLR